MGNQSGVSWHARTILQIAILLSIFLITANAQALTALSPTTTGGQQPQPYTYVYWAGSPVSLTAHASGGTPSNTGTYTYKWFDGPSPSCAADTIPVSDLNGFLTETTPTFTFDPTKYAYTYICYQVTDSASTPVTVLSPTDYIANTLIAGPITAVPVPPINPSTSITLTSNAVGGITPYTYTWYSIPSGTAPDCSKGTLITGATSSSYTAAPSATTYYCYQVVDNSPVPFTRNSAAYAVIVTPAPPLCSCGQTEVNTKGTVLCGGCPASCPATEVVSGIRYFRNSYLNAAVAADFSSTFSIVCQVPPSYYGCNACSLTQPGYLCPQSCPYGGSCIYNPANSCFGTGARGGLSRLAASIEGCTGTSSPGTTCSSTPPPPPPPPTPPTPCNVGSSNDCAPGVSGTPSCSQTTKAQNGNCYLAKGETTCTYYCSQPSTSVNPSAACKQLIATYTGFNPSTAWITSFINGYTSGSNQLLSQIGQSLTQGPLGWLGALIGGIVLVLATIASVAAGGIAGGAWAAASAIGGTATAAGNTIAWLASHLPQYCLLH